MDSLQNFRIGLADIRALAQAAENSLRRESDNLNRDLGNATTRAALVLLTGYFEGFIRDLSGDFVDNVLDKEIKISKIPNNLFSSWILDRIQSQPLAAYEIKQLILEDKCADLNKRKISKTGGNPTVDTIESIFSVLGIDSIIDRLSKLDYSIETTFIEESQISPSMRTELVAALSRNAGQETTNSLSEIFSIIDKKWKPKKKRRKVGYVHEIEELLRKRNNIAHGEERMQITVEELNETADCLEKLAEGLHSSVRMLIESFDLSEQPMPTLNT